MRRKFRLGRFKYIIGFIFLVVIAATFEAIQPAQAALITASPLELNLSNDGPGYADVTVYNTGDKKAYVQLEVQRVLNPGKKNEKKILADHKHPINFGLVASPLKMVIPVNQSRKVRVLPLATGLKQERVYILNITPVEGELKMIGGSAKDGKSIQAGVKITVGYGVRVVLRPKTPKRDLILAHKDNTGDYYLDNKGNVNILITQASVCEDHSSKNANKWKNCRLVKSFSKRLFAGNKWKVPAFDQLASYSSKDSKEKVRFKGYLGDKAFWVAGG